MRTLKILILLSFLFCIVKTGREVKLFGSLEGELLADIFNNAYRENTFILAIVALQAIGVFATIKNKYRYNYIMLIVAFLLGCMVLAGTLTLDSMFQVRSIPNIIFLVVAAIYVKVYVEKYNVI